MHFFTEASRQRLLDDIRDDRHGLRRDLSAGVSYSGMVDVGAETGIVSLAFKMMWPKASVIAIEPDVRHFTIMSDNLAGLDSTCVRRSLGDGQFYGNLPPHMCLSTLPEFGPGVHKGGSDSGSLTQLIEHHGGDWSGWFLKINANGAERHLDNDEDVRTVGKFKRVLLVAHPGYEVPVRIRELANVEIVQWWR